MNISIPWLQIDPIAVDILATSKRSDTVDFSIIVASYNRISCLPQLIASIGQQVGDHSYEIVIVDDASTQGDLPSILSLPHSDKMTLARLQKNSGSEALPQNVGVYLAQSDILFFIDSDDYLCDPHATSLMYKTMQGNSECNFAFSNIIFQIELEKLPTTLQWIDEENDFYPTPMHQMQFTKRSNRYRIRAAQPYSFFDLMVFAYAIGLRAFKKQAIIRVGGWPLNLKSHDDFGLLLLLAAEGYRNNCQNMLPVNTNGYVYRITGDQTSALGVPDDEIAQRSFLMKVLHENHISYAQLEEASRIQKEQGKVGVLERWNITKEELTI